MTTLHPQEQTWIRTHPFTVALMAVMLVAATGLVVALLNLEPQATSDTTTNAFDSAPAPWLRHDEVGMVLRAPGAAAVPPPWALHEGAPSLTGSTVAPAPWAIHQDARDTGTAATRPAPWTLHDR